MSYKPTVTVLGANGTIGVHVLRALVSDTFKHSFTLPIRVVTRDSAKIQSDLVVTDSDLKGYSANVETGEGLDAAFKGADVVVNLLGAQFSHNSIVDAAAAAGSVKLYFPSEFGSYIGNAGPFKNIFASKTANLDYALSKGLHAVSVSNGNFAEWTFNLPIVGLNALKPGQFLYYGDLDTKFTATSLVDVGKAVAALSAKDPTTVPRDVFIGGATVSLREFKAVYEKAFQTKLEDVARPLDEIVQKADAVCANGVQSMEDFLAGLSALLATGRIVVEPKHNDFVAKGAFEFRGLEEVAAELAAQK